LARARKERISYLAELIAVNNVCRDHIADRDVLKAAGYPNEQHNLRPNVRYNALSLHSCGGITLPVSTIVISQVRPSIVNKPVS
jgi:hypothetical protein